MWRIMAFGDLMTRTTANDANKATAKAIIARMAKAYDVDKQQLPGLIDSQMNTINNWVYYGRIPYRKVLLCSQQTGESIDWLVTGMVTSRFNIQQQSTELTSKVHQIIDDCVDYGIISASSDQGIRRMKYKIDLEVQKSLGLANTAQSAPIKK